MALAYSSLLAAYSAIGRRGKRNPSLAISLQLHIRHSQLTRRRRGFLLHNAISMGNINAYTFAALRRLLPPLMYRILIAFSMG